MTLQECVEQAYQYQNKLECDGLTRVLSYLLTENNTPHQVFAGSAYYAFERSLFHMWIVAENCIIDLKAKFWLSDYAQEGIIPIAECETKYLGEQVPLKVNSFIYAALTQ